MVLMSGSIFAQMAVVIAAPFLTRLFTPHEIGIYTFLLTTATLFMAVINGRYDISIVTEVNEVKVYALIKLSVVISIVFSILITIIYYLYMNLISKNFQNENYIYFVLLLLLLSFGINNVLVAYNNRNKEYKIITKVYIIKSFIQNFGAVILGFIGMGLFGLIVPYVIGQFIGVNWQLRSLKPNLKKIISISVTEMKDVFKLHYKQPLYSAPALFANSLSYSSITFSIAYLFGMSAVGFYFMSVRLLGIPLTLISGNVSKVFLEAASREYDETRQFCVSLKKTLLLLTALAVPMVIFMMVLSPFLFGLVFGEEWVIAGKYVTILAPMFGIRFIVTTITPGLIIAKAQNLELLLQMGFIVSAGVSLVIAKIEVLQIEGYLQWISISFSFIYLLILLIIIKKAKVSK
jgi:O-antigen/teichoic acid export membrane protein